MARRRLLCVALVAAVLYGSAAAQTASCAVVPGGCSAGMAHDAAVRGAMARFDPNTVYGAGSDPVVFSSFLDAGSLAQVAYSCRNGADPPPLSGAALRSL